jgi:hypothetical protein
MFKFTSIVLLLGFLICLSASEIADYSDSKADCLILKDENSIICKYTHKRINSDKVIQFQWIEPNGVISRQRDMIIPAGHGSVYDYRYKTGRTQGEWTFKVIDNSQEFTTQFTLE